MTSRHTLAFVSLAAVALAGSVYAQEGSGRPFTVTMTGAAERPGPGDADGTGTAEFRINPGQGQVCYKLTVSNILPAFAAHIHRAPPTAAGPVVIGLEPPTDGTSDACAHGVPRDLLQEIIRDPGAFYVNVHNAPFPGGAVRGQLSRTP